MKDKIINSINNTSKSRLILYAITSLAAVIIILVGTYAWLQSYVTSDEISGEVSANQVKINFDDGEELKVENIGPVLDYNDGVILGFNIENTNQNNLEITIKLHINSISSTLANENFKYILLTSTDGTTYAPVSNINGNFVGATANSDKIIVGTNNALTTSSTQIYYQFIVYLDGNYYNSNDLMNNTLDSYLEVNTESSTQTTTNFVTALLNKANSSSNQDYTTSTDDEKAQMYTFSHEATAQTTAQTDYRFIGSTPNNYVYYNCTDTDNQSADTCETWRILGVFPTDDGTGNIENRVKIVSGTGIAAVNTNNSSVQYGFSWDSSVSGTDGATNNYGINQWGPTTLSDETTAYAGADLMQLLNEGAYYNRTTGDCYISSSNSKITCDFNSSSTSIKTRGLSDSAKSIISDAQYYLGGIPYDSTSHYGTGSDIYTRERGTTTYNGTDVVRTTNWNGEVALMYPSDYVYSYAYGVDDTCYNDSYNCDISAPTSGWIYNSNTKDGTTTIYINWLLSPGSGSSYLVFRAYSAGYVGYSHNAYIAYLVRPVVYLESDIQSLKGDGSEENPYQLIY